MKTFKISNLFLAFSLLMSSCQTYQKFTVLSTPNTEIYDPSGTLIGKADNKGKTKLKLPAGEYYAYLWAKEPQMETPVPFALDYHKNKHIWTRVAKATGVGLASIGGVGLLIGTGALIGAAANGDEDNQELFGLVIGASSGVVGMGMALGMPADARLDQATYAYNLSYNKKQTTNNDLQLVKPVVSYYYDKEPTTSSTQKTKSADKTNKNKEIASSSSRSKKDNAGAVEGEYLGSGSISKLKKTIETYDNIVIIISKKTSNTVFINIIDEDGNMFFDEDEEYKVVKNKNGTYTLTNIKVPSATITIDKSFNATYKHPKVNIDDNIYTLTVKAKK